MRFFIIFYEIDPPVRLGGNGWRNRVETDERTKGIRSFHGSKSNVLGNYWGAIGIDVNLEYARFVGEPFWQFLDTQTKYGGRIGPISDEELFPLIERSIYLTSRTPFLSPF